MHLLYAVGFLTFAGLAVLFVWPRSGELSSAYERRLEDHFGAWVEGAAMRLIVHIEDLADLHVAKQAVQTCEENGYRECAFGFGAKLKAFARRNKTGWTVYVQREDPERAA